MLSPTLAHLTSSGGLILASDLVIFEGVPRSIGDVARECVGREVLRFIQERDA